MKKFLVLALVIAMGFTTCGDVNPSGDTYTITFNNTSGTGGQTASVTATYGKDMPVITKKPSKEGYYFNGYWDEESGGTMYYKPDLTSAKKWDKKEKATLYAQWTQILLTTITFDANEGEGTMDVQQIPANSSANLSANEFTRTFYEFAGWATSSDGPKVYNNEQSYSAAAGTNSVTLYAVWTPLLLTTITFNASGGSGEMLPQKIVEETSENLTLNTFSRLGFIFAGWDTSSAGQNVVYTDGQSYTALEGTNSVTLYAVWNDPPPPVVSSDFSAVSIVRNTEVEYSSNGNEPVKPSTDTSTSYHSNFTYEQILAMVREAIKLAGGLDGIVKTGDNVVLKPNLICTVWSWGTGTTSTMAVTGNGVITDWRVTHAVSQIVREKIGAYDSVNNKGKIMVIEGPGKSSTTGSSLHHFTLMGYTTTNLTFVNEIIPLETDGGTYSAGNSINDTTYATQVTLSSPFYTGATSANNGFGQPSFDTYYKNDGKYWVNKKMYEADVLICIPVVKTHWNATVTGAIKNIGIGAAPPKIYGISANDVGRNAMVNHSSPLLQDWIADYFSCLPADFVVMDGLQGLESGPLPGASNNSTLAGFQKNLRCILASKDALAIDMVAANIVNADYTSIRYLTNLATRSQIAARPSSNRTTIPLRGAAKDIVVLGNVTVSDIRADYTIGAQAGNTGVALTPAKKTPPTVAINSAEFSGTDLNLALTLSNGADNAVVKIDVYIDGLYKASFNTAMTSVSVDATGIAAGSHSIKVLAYTDYMFSATATTTANKSE